MTCPPPSQAVSPSQQPPPGKLGPRLGPASARQLECWSPASAATQTDGSCSAPPRQRNRFITAFRPRVSKPDSRWLTRMACGPAPEQTRTGSQSDGRRRPTGAGTAGHGADGPAAQIRALAAGSGGDRVPLSQFESVRVVSS